MPLVESNYRSREDKIRANSNFTDVTLFQGYRLFLRKSDIAFDTYESDNNQNTCDQGDKPSERLADGYVDKTKTEKDKTPRFEDPYLKSGRTRVYIQKIDEKTCTGETFDDVDESPIVLVKEYSSSPCNPDRFVR